MKYKHKYTFFIVLFFLVFSHLFLSSPGKSYFAISIFSILYIFSFRFGFHFDSYFLLFCYIFIYTLYNIYTGKIYFINDYYIHILVLLNPFIAKSLSNCTCKYSSNSYIAVLSILYIASVLDTVLYTGTGRLTGMVFHHSNTALIGTVLAIEIFRHKCKYTLSAAALLIIVSPIVGNLRQYVYILLPTIALLIYKRRFNVYLLYSALLFTILIALTPIGNQLQLLRSDVQSKSESFRQLYESSYNLQESTITLRMEWWEAAINSTKQYNIFFGHNLYYQYYRMADVNIVSDSSMLHSYYVGCFSDGGLVLLFIVLYIFLKNLYYAIKVKDYYSALILYSFTLMFGLNTLALSVRYSLLLFLIYCNYDSSLLNERHRPM